jgi:hypothetical protein
MSVAPAFKAEVNKEVDPSQPSQAQDLGGSDLSISEQARAASIHEYSNPYDISRNSTESLVSSQGQELSIPREMAQFSSALDKLGEDLDRVAKTNSLFVAIKEKLDHSYDGLRELRSYYGEESYLYASEFADQLNEIFDCAKEARMALNRERQNPLGISKNGQDDSFSFEVDRNQQVSFHWDHYDLQTRRFGLGSLDKGQAGYKPMSVDSNTMDVSEGFHVTRRFDQGRGKDIYIIEPYDSFKGRIQIKSGRQNGLVYVNSIANTHLEAPNDNQALGVDREKLFLATLNYWRERSMSRRVTLPNETSLESGGSLSFDMESDSQLVLVSPNHNRISVEANSVNLTNGFPKVSRQESQVNIQDDVGALEGKYALFSVPVNGTPRNGSFIKLKDDITKAPGLSEAWLVEGEKVVLKIHPRRSIKVVVGSGTTSEKSYSIAPGQNSQDSDFMNIHRNENGDVVCSFPGTAREGRYDLYLDNQKEPFTRIMAVSAVTNAYLEERKN